MGCLHSSETKKMTSNLIRNRTVGHISDFYDHVKTVGEGSMGAIAIIRHKTTEKEYAVKKIIVNRITPDMIEEMNNEISLLRDLDHPNIIIPLEVFHHKHRQIFFVMELCSGGDLYTRDPYTEDQTLRIMIQIISAIEYLHEKHIVHRDLKFEKVLFESNKWHAKVKLIDFGLSKRYTRGTRMIDSVGTLYSMAPEVLDGNYNDECDIWSIGVIAYMLLCSKMPFVAYTEREIVTKIKTGDFKMKGKRWKRISEAAKNFIKQCLVVNLRKRYTINDCIASEWISENAHITNEVFRPEDGSEEVEVEGEESKHEGKSSRNSSSSSHHGNRHVIESKGSMADEIMDDESFIHSIQNFSSYGKLKKLALMLVAKKSSVDSIMGLREVFESLDDDLSGTIDIDEFRRILGSHHPELTEEEVNRLFVGMDVDQSGLIHYTEFLAASLETMGNLKEMELIDAFDRLDSDDSGYITKANLKEILGADYTKEEVAQMIAEADVKKDGRIDLNEFLDLFRTFHDQKITEMDGQARSSQEAKEEEKEEKRGGHETEDADESGLVRSPTSEDDKRRFYDPKQADGED